MIFWLRHLHFKQEKKKLKIYRRRQFKVCMSITLEFIEFNSIFKKMQKNGRKLNAGNKTSDETKNKKKFLYISSVVVVGANKQFILYLRSEKKIFEIFYLKKK